MTFAVYVDSLVGDIETSGLEEIVIVAHSMGAIPLPGVVAKLGSARVREMIFAAAFLPPEGTSIVDDSPWQIAMIARQRAKENAPTRDTLGGVLFDRIRAARPAAAPSRGRSTSAPVGGVVVDSHSGQRLSSFVECDRPSRRARFAPRQ